MATLRPYDEPDDFDRARPNIGRPRKYSGSRRPARAPRAEREQVGFSRPSHEEYGGTLSPPGMLSPPRAPPSPQTELVLLPGGGVQIPEGYRIDAEDQGRYRRDRRGGEGGPDDPRVLGGLSFGVFKGLRNLPRAIARAGKASGHYVSPREQERNLELEEEQEYDEPMPPEEEEPAMPVPQPYAPAPMRQEELEREEQEEEEEVERETREDRRYRRHMVRIRQRRDRHQIRSDTFRPSEPRHLGPMPTPIPVPGAFSSAQGPPPPTIDAVLEAEEMERERRALEAAQELDRTVHVYAADVVKTPASARGHGSAVSGRGGSSTGHRRARTEPGMPNRVYSRWRMSRDVEGYRKENHLEFTPNSEQLSLGKLLKQIWDLPWVGERVAADYIPGGSRAKHAAERQRQRWANDAMSDSTFSSPVVHGHRNGLRPNDEESVASPSPSPPRKPKSWYSPRGDVPPLPMGLTSPPGYIPFPPPPMPPPMMAQMRGHGPVSRGSPQHSGSSETHVDDGPRVAYVNGQTYTFLPAALSPTGEPSFFVPMPAPGASRSRSPVRVGGGPPVFSPSRGRPFIPPS